MEWVTITIWVFVALVFTGCSSKPSNEISQMAESCFKNHQAIRIEFTPAPEIKHTLEETK